MLCIKGFADPLCYLLSLLPPRPTQLLGRIKLLRCRKPLEMVNTLFLGRIWSPGALACSWLALQIMHTLTRETESKPLSWVHSTLLAGGGDASAARSSPSVRWLSWPYLVSVLFQWETILAWSSFPTFQILLSVCPICLCPDLKVHPLDLPFGCSLHSLISSNIILYPNIQLHQTALSET